MSNKEPLKACPFCGGQPHTVEDDNLARCSDPQCPCYGYFRGVDGKSSCGAIANTTAWNTRPIEDKLRQQRDGLMDACKSVHAYATNMYDEGQINKERHKIITGRLMEAIAKGERE